MAKYEGGWIIKEEMGKFTLITPSGQVKGTFSTLKEAKKRMEQIRALKKMSQQENNPVKQEDKFFKGKE